MCGGEHVPGPHGSRRAGGGTPLRPVDAMRVESADDDLGMRVDVWLHRRLPHLSRARIQALIVSGAITVGGQRAKAHQKVAAGAVADVVIPAAEEAEAVAQDIPIVALYEDADLIVVDKPAGLVVHPAAGHASGTLVNALLYRCRDLAGIGGKLRPGIVHRLDRDTSGAMVVAKNEFAMASLVSQFKRGEIHKWYTAVVHGTPSPRAGRIETSIGRSLRDRKKMSVKVEGGRKAVTLYEVKEAFPMHSLVAVKIETGRTHQIRVHMAHVGHPVLGDRVYGPSRPHVVGDLKISRQMLHAERLSLIHPRTGRRLDFAAALPPDLLQVLQTLREATNERHLHH